MIIHRLLDVFFRTLDVVDAARDRVDRALGREPAPDPWAVEWPPPPDTASENAAPKKVAAPEEDVATDDTPSPSETPKKAPAKKAATSTKASKSAAKTPTAKKKAKAKGGRKKSANANRKGSVDRSGRDVDSPRARAVYEAWKASGEKALGEEAALNNKKVLGRVVWALACAGEAGSEKGMTTNDVAAFLSLSSDIEVFATNIGRACRDHSDLIEETEPDGRSKRYRLTDEGRAAAQTLR